jgi:hypothetical protein
MKQIEITLQELFDALKTNIYRNKKKYYRKVKHKKKGDD